MAIKIPSGLTNRQRYQQPTEEELQQQQQRTASALAERDAANPRIGQPGKDIPTQRKLASTQKPGVFDEPKPGGGMAAPSDSAISAMKDASNQPTTTPEGDAARRAARNAPAATQEQEKGSIFDVDTEGERAAFQQELEANRAKAMQQAEARAGLAGMGLSGATGQLVSDVGRQQQRAGQLAMSEFDRQQAAAKSQEAAAKFQEIQRQASIWDLEQAENQDIDGDGFRGNPDVGEKPGDPQSDVLTNEQIQTLNTLKTDDYAFGDPDTGPGTRQEPYSVSMEQMQELTSQGFRLKPISDTINGKQSFVDQYGNYYILAG